MPFTPHLPELPRNATTLTGKLIKPLHTTRWAVIADKDPIRGWKIFLQLDSSLPKGFKIGSKVHAPSAREHACAGRPAVAHRCCCTCRSRSTAPGGLTMQATPPSLSWPRFIMETPRFTRLHLHLCAKRRARNYCARTCSHPVFSP